ncbi:hypothetical protein V2A60_000927 [Cordyceps javanica]|uniref:HLH transcription factor (Hpa3) n=1 Tax=Cordyceps javanica TaxID=43265 RepID=A0A545V208_9HYPO|nr:HLH transcription factor (Hpa3) [Cordyceps javanica]TQW07051.1 HLH transcription factor (Hpa3) [Cordyceps javanica]
MPAAAAQRPANAAGLTNILNKDEPSAQSAPPPQLRDSGFYSTAEASSKHNSGASFNAAGLSPATSGYQSSAADKTPSPIAANTVPHPQLSPTSAANMSVAAMVSPSSSVGADRRFDRPGSHEFPGHLGDGLGPASNMRRESVDSRINQGLSDMRLGGSPYTSNNQSTTSIQSTLHNQRNPRGGIDSYASHRISNGYQPNNDRNPENKAVRTAPAITGPATGNIARAAEPTKGQAWAFPEEEIKRVSHYDESRRSSVTDSLASSQFTTESRLPSGQRRLEDSEFARMSAHSSDFPSVHHHTMQHKQLSDLQAEEGAGGPGAQPYSRTPELRVSHKLAERKRRTEMKELFDQLRDLMPQERGSKASKWEILTKAITEYQKQTDHIRILQMHHNNAMSDIESLRRELQSVKMELAQARGEAQPPAPSQSQNHAAPAHAFPPEHYQSTPSGTELPPLRSINNGMPNGPDSMTGVQYDGPRTNGYHRNERY